MQKVCLSVKDLTKSFGGIHALKGANIDFYEGEVHAFAGENGAGKSTLCKILSGAYHADKGTIELNGTEHTAFTPKSAKEAGIAMIYQEFNLVPEMTVYENIFLGKEIKKAGIVNRRAMIEKTNELFKKLHIEIPATTKINDLSVAYCQLVEIGKALLENAKIMIFDEPTAPLTNDEVEVLFDIISQLKNSGMTIIYISHRMEEIMGFTDRVTIMRDGEVIKTMPTRETNRQEIISLMVGREIDENFPKREPSGSVKRETALEVKNLTNKRLNDVSFDVRYGEIFGIAGLVGAGRSEIVRAIFGADRLMSGEIVKNGKVLHIKNPPDAIKSGIGMVPEDRKRFGLHLQLPIRTNLTLAKIRELSKLLVIDGKREKKALDDFIKSLSIKLANVNNPVSSLSGGNQQKVVVSKWLLTDADVLIFDEPTRGIDVGAKVEIYDILDKLRKQGKAIIMISSEMPELIGLCDRMTVMYEGKQQGFLNWEEMTQVRIMELASGTNN